MLSTGMFSGERHSCTRRDLERLVVGCIRLDLESWRSDCILPGLVDCIHRGLSGEQCLQGCCIRLVPWRIDKEKTE